MRNCCYRLLRFLVKLSFLPFILYKLKPRFARFQLECPMPIALRAPSRECISRFALRLGFARVVDWNVSCQHSVVRKPWPTCVVVNL